MACHFLDCRRSLASRWILPATYRLEVPRMLRLRLFGSIIGGLAWVGLLAGCEQASSPEPASEAEHEHLELEEHLVSGAIALATFETQDGWRISPIEEAPYSATRVGFLVDFWADQTPVDGLELEARGFFEDGSSTEWMDATVTWREHPYAVARAELGAQVDRVQFRISDAQLRLVSHITWVGTIPENEGRVAAQDPALEPGLAQVEAPLAAAFANLGVKSRAAWNAKATKCTSSDAAKSRIAIHHTVTPPTASGTYEARLRSIQTFHMDSNGWCDVGYHFLVTADGSLWEGRPYNYVGAHVGGQNTGNAGISFVGCHHTSGCASFGGSVTPSDTQLNAAAKLVAHIAKTNNITINTTNVRGHRDFPGQSTTCPGDLLHGKLGTIRSKAIEINSGGTAPPPPPPAKGQILGVVFDGSKTSSPTAPGNVRITSATVSLNGGAAKAVSAPDALFTFTGVSAGTHSLVFKAPGFNSFTRTVTVTAGADTWASTGLTPVPTTATLTVVVTRKQGTSTVPLSGAIVHVPGAGAKQSGADGKVTFTLKTAAAKVNTFAAGYTAVQNTSVNVPLGTTFTHYVNLNTAPAPGSVGTLKGVVWNAAVTAGPSDPGNQRVGTAIVTCSCGQAMWVNATSAYWQFSCPPGTWTTTAIAPGFKEKSQTIVSSAGKETWGSIGITP
jgi:hypothetical protein